MSAIDPTRARLEEFRAWVRIRVETREDPPPVWYRYYRLRQDPDALPADILVAVPIDPPRLPARHRPDLRLIVDHDDGDPRR
jgi:hypothetical protein